MADDIANQQVPPPVKQESFINPIGHDNHQNPNMVPAGPTQINRSYSVSSVFTSADNNMFQSNNIDVLLDKFKYIKRKLKLNLQKVSAVLGVSKSALQKFNSGRDPNCSFRHLIESWVYSTENLEALQCYENEKLRHMRNNQVMPKDEPGLNLNRAQHVNFAYQQQRDRSLGGTLPPKPSRSSNNMTPMGAPINGFDAYGSVVGPYTGRQRSQRQEHQIHTSHQHQQGSQQYQTNSSSSQQLHRRRSFQQNQSITLLAQMLKRETHSLLHKGIDGAINDYLDQSKALKLKMQSQPHTRETDYFYKKQGKLLLNRLTTICGDDVVNSATSYLSQKKAESANRSGYTEKRHRNSSIMGIEMQRLAHLTKAWNHACSCKMNDCTYPSCEKIKPAVAHQLKLKDERRRLGNQAKQCTALHCSHCQLYNMLKKFSNTARATTSSRMQQGTSSGARPAAYDPNVVSGQYSGPPPTPHNNNQLVNVPPPAQRRSESRHSYSESHKFNQNSSSHGHSSKTRGAQSGDRTVNNMYNQQNNTTTNTQHINNTNVNYNTYNIHKTAPTVKSEKSRRSTDVDDGDMSAVAEMLDERKHNVNINVNVNLEPFYSQKRKQEPLREKSPYVKKPRQTPLPGQGQSQTGPTPNMYNESFYPNNPISSANAAPTPVEDDFADLFQDNEIKAKDDEREDAAGRRVLCVVCHGKERDALFKPCNHCCACMTCALKLRHCPMCRMAVSSTSHIFLS